MVENGFYNFLNWFDSRAWYPLGRIVGGTVSTYIIQREGGLELLYKSMTNHEKLNQVQAYLAENIFTSFCNFSKNENSRCICSCAIL